MPKFVLIPDSLGLKGINRLPHKKGKNLLQVPGEIKIV